MYNSASNSVRYKRIKKIGQGGTSSVYLCVDNHINQKWAVKILKNSYIKEFASKKTSDENNKKDYDGLDLLAIESEIELLKSFDYYMFPRIVDAFFEEGSIGIVTDYIEGESLKSYIKREGPLPINVALHYFEELLMAIRYLHSQSPPILYLDMKPDNIMVKKDKTIRLIDFGIASSILLKSKSYGTVGYSPPEQYIKDGILTKKADVFALAMTLYSMLTGKEPDKNLNTQIINIKRSERIPKTIKNLIIKCIRKDAGKRPSVEEVLLYLKGKRLKDKGNFIGLFAGGVLILSACLIVFLFPDYTRERNYEKNKEEMISKASAYVENGEYTTDGIKIICGYLNGNFLDDETKDFFTYEVAKYYFEVKRDYASAKSYFLRLDNDKYPESQEYIQKCNSMRRFSSFDEEVKEMFITDF